MYKELNALLISILDTPFSNGPLLLVCKICYLKKKKKKKVVKKKWYGEDMRVTLDIYDNKGCQWHIKMP